MPAEVTTDRAPACPRVLEELIPSAQYTVERYATDPGRDRSRPAEGPAPADARGLKRDRSARIISAGHVFVQNLRRGHYELAIDVSARHRLQEAFDQLTMAI
jgi:transposase, IS6 family